MSGKGRSLSALQQLKRRFFWILCHRKRTSWTAFWRSLPDRSESFAGYSFVKPISALPWWKLSELYIWKPTTPLLSLWFLLLITVADFTERKSMFMRAKMSEQKSPPVSTSANSHTTVYGTDVYLGLMHIESLEAAICSFIRRERIMVITVHWKIFVKGFI